MKVCEVNDETVALISETLDIPVEIVEHYRTLAFDFYKEKEGKVYATFDYLDPEGEVIDGVSFTTEQVLRGRFIVNYEGAASRFVWAEPKGNNI